MRLVTFFSIAIFLLTSVDKGFCELLTQDVYARNKKAILQIRILDRDTGAKTSIGSGFVVAPGNLVVTNYHVISELISRPEQYDAIYHAEGNISGALQLLAIDVVHDLAILQSDIQRQDFLTFAAQRPKQGERLFSFGNPHDLGLTIVEGIYNGLLEKSLHEKIHFTGSINPGMSGGPTVDAQGLVVGINVATAGNQISFLVPAAYAFSLQQEVEENGLTPVNFTEKITEQLLENQQKYMTALLSEPLKTEAMGDYQLPAELAPFIKCWGDSREKKDHLYLFGFRTCATDDDIYLTGGQNTGILQFRNELMSTTELNPVRFYNFLESHFNRPHLGLYGDEEQVTDYQCHDDIVEHGELQSKLVYCLRGYKDYPGLYDSFMTASTLISRSEALHTTLVMAGVSRENAKEFSRRFLEAIKWKP